MQTFLFDGWNEVKDGNDDARAIFDRHYSRYNYADGRQPKLFMGPGEKMVLVRTSGTDGSALCAWRKFISADGQDGINCAIFRNEGAGVASAILAEAMKICWARWPGQRLYTYVNPRAVEPVMVKGYPVWGWVFYKAGWRYAGMTKKRGYHILEVQP